MKYPIVVPTLDQIVNGRMPTKRQLRQFFHEHRNELEKFIEGDVPVHVHDALCHGCHNHVEALEMFPSTTPKE